jgi:ribonuclease HI
MEEDDMEEEDDFEDHDMDNDEDSDDDDENHDPPENPPGGYFIPYPLDSGLGRECTVGTGRVIPTKFHPPNPSDTPESLFPLRIGEMSMPPVHRFIRPSNTATQFLIYTDGACLDNGGANPRAGCAFVFKPTTQNPLVHGYTAFRLENEGPTSERHAQTSNRAELRAVIAALRFRYWPGEGADALVIATDSEYVAEGITTWVRGWLRRDWKTSMGSPVKNQDLWQCLLGEVEFWNEKGMCIEFWRIPREWNTEADRLAKKAANEDPIDKFVTVSGVLV